MNFGSVKNIDSIDFTLPPDSLGTAQVLASGNKSNELEIYVGCGTLDKKKLANFYPPGVKDELEYYSTQFNSIEFNATFYQPYEKQQYHTWYHKTPSNFKFFPKINQTVSHLRRLNNVQEQTLTFLNAALGFQEKLGIVFLQLHDRFKIKDYSRLETFIQNFPKNSRLAVEVRDESWLSDRSVKEKLFLLMEEYNVTNIITDTAGRRDLLHMRLTTKTAFIRWVGSNHHDSDRKRLEDWVERIKIWKNLGLEELCFFVHQNEEIESPALAAHFIEKLNQELSLRLSVPHVIDKLSNDQLISRTTKEVMTKISDED